MLVPLVAIGAAVAGGLVMKALSSSSPDKEGEKSSRAKQSEPRPETYVVTRIQGDGARERISAVDAVKKLIV